jgi:hypothetical protein
MRYPTIATLAGLALAALAACTDAASRLAAPPASSESQFAVAGDSPSLTKSGQGGSQNGDDEDKDRDNEKGWKGRDRDDDGDDDYGGHGPKDKITICHAAGRAGTTKYVEITVSRNASYAHLDEHGTPRAGHEEDYYAEEGRGCNGRGTIKKTLVEVKTSGPNGSMPDDPTWHAGGAVTIPAGETRWLYYRIDYSLPSGTYGTITEDKAAVCATAGAGFNCSFNTGNKYSWSVKGSGSLIVQIDLTNKSVCGSRTFVNTAKLTPKNGSPISASASTPLTLTCATPIKFIKKLVSVMKEGPGGPGTMMPDPAWSMGSSLVVIPLGETRWLDYALEYTLPNGVTGTISEDTQAVCATLGTFRLQCTFSLPLTPDGVFTWPPVTGSGTTDVMVDLGGGGAGSCGDHVFKNTAKLTPSVGSPVFASHEITVRVVCPPAPPTFTKTLVSVMKAGATPGSMIPDPSWTPGSSLVVIPIGETRWLDYELSYSLPAGVTGTISEDTRAVCGTLGTFRLQCTFGLPLTPDGVFTWPPVTGTGVTPVMIDLGGGGAGSCGDKVFTNTAKLTLSSGGTPLTAAKAITVRVVCPNP